MIDGVAVIELVSVPIALTVLAGSALAQWRARREGHPVADAELLVWLAGLVIAVLPSVVAPVESLRVWLVVVVPLAVALAAVLVPIRGVRTLRMWSAIVLTAGALAMGARTLAVATFASSEAAVITAGFGALVVAAAMVWTAQRLDVDIEIGPRVPDAVSTVTAAVAAALLVAAVVVLSDGELPRTTLTVLIAAVGAVGGRGAARIAPVAESRGRFSLSRASSARWSPSGRASSSSGTRPAHRSSRICGRSSRWASPPRSASWPLRATKGTPVAEPVAMVVGVAFSAALLFFTAVEWLMLGADAGDELRTVVTMSALTVAGFGGVLLRWRLGLTPPLTAAIAAAVFGVAALVLYGVTPVELVTVPPALGLIVLGARALRRTPRARTWPTLGPGLALLTVPSLLHDFFGDDGPVARRRTRHRGDRARRDRRGVAPAGPARARLGRAARSTASPSSGHGSRRRTSYVPWWLWLGHRRRAAHLSRRALREPHARPPHRVHRGGLAALSRLALRRRRSGAGELAGAAAPAEGRDRRVAGDPEAPRERIRARDAGDADARAASRRRSSGSSRSSSRATAPPRSAPVIASMPSCTGCRSPTASPKRPGPRARSRSVRTTPRRSGDAGSRHPAPRRPRRRAAGFRRRRPRVRRRR